MEGAAVRSGATVLAIGLMSGTSRDGVDAALLRTDGNAIVICGPASTTPYTADFRQRLAGVSGGRGHVAAIERELTLLHGIAARQLMATAGLSAADVTVIGFHGHTILHEPAQRRTWQIGDGALLAAATDVDVIDDFRSADVRAGGQGAPLVPVFHAALAAELERPIAVLNIGGVANVTWVGAGPSPQLVAFDTGPGNAMLDDWVLRHTGLSLDADGALARAGQIDRDALGRLLADAYFTRPAPKSLDRDAFGIAPLHGLSVADGAATLVAFTTSAAARAAAQFPQPARRWLVAGGGRRNPSIMTSLRERVSVPVEPVESVGWDGDALEAQAFAYLAVRSLLGLPLTFPGTTGVPRALAGGRHHRRPSPLAT